MKIRIALAIDPKGDWNVALKGREHDGFLRDAIAKATGGAE